MELCTKVFFHMQPIAGPLVGTMWAATQFEKQSANKVLLCHNRWEIHGRTEKAKYYTSGAMGKTCVIIFNSEKNLFKCNYPLTKNKIKLNKTPKRYSFAINRQSCLQLLHLD